MSSSNEKRSLLSSFLARNFNGYDTIDSVEPTLPESFVDNEQFIYEDGPKFRQMPGRIIALI